MAKTGRPENSDVWKYFKHDEETKVSVHLVGAELLRKETVVSKSRESIQQIWEVISRKSTHKSSVLERKEEARKEKEKWRNLEYPPQVAALA